MNASDRAGFLADESALDPEDFVFETYVFETAGDAEETAVHLCAEHSTALWSRPGVDEDYRPRHAAKLVRLEVLEKGVPPVLDLPYHRGEVFTRVRARIAHPHRNFGPRIPNLLTAVCGEGAFFAPGASMIKLMDLEFPSSFLDRFPGPAFGVEGLRALLQAWDRPIFLGVVKPNVGLEPDAFARLAYASWLGGLDAPKDDEMLADAEDSPFERRAARLGSLRKRAEDETGRPLMFIGNITDEVERMASLLDVAVASGVNAVMINGVATGLPAVRFVRERSSVPMVGHFDLIAPSSRLPFFGVHSVVWTKLQRLAGFDAIIMPGFGDRMYTPPPEVLANVRACLDPMGNLRRSLPVPGGSDWAGTLGAVHERLGTVDFGFVPGRGVFGHPGGPEEGARSIVDAWEAIREGKTLEEKATESEPVRRAIEAFHPPSH